MVSKIIATFGLAFDMVGAIFVAIEVVKVYRGQKRIKTTIAEIGCPTEDFKKHEKNKRNYMIIGLILLCLGFILQIIAIWIEKGR